MARQFTWSRYGGYEVSTKGDKRFSAFNAILLNGWSIENTYQVEIKGYRSWREGKGKPPLDPTMTREKLWEAYLDLWRCWAGDHPELMIELRDRAMATGKTILSDCFASSDINQARALATILNELFVSDEGQSSLV